MATIAPVFALSQTQMILRDILGHQLDFALLDKQIAKMKNQINLQTNKLPLVDDDGAGEVEKTLRARMTEEHRRIRKSVEQRIADANLYVPTDQSGIKSVNGDPIDEVSLLSLIAG